VSLGDMEYNQGCQDIIRFVFTVAMTFLLGLISGLGILISSSV
jgi:hypothetical protein